MRLKLVIFDLDGTLVDTLQDITNALNYAVEPYDFKTLTVSETRRMVGEGITRLIEKILGEDKLRLRDSVRERFLNYYSAHLIDYSMPYPDVKETLKRLGGYRKAVVSNKMETLSRRLLQELELLGYFDLVVGSDTVNEKKPSARPILHVINKLDVSPDDAVIVGDSNYDIEAGRNAGIKTIAVTYGYRDRELLKAADFMIDSMKDLIPLLFVAFRD